jgi:hypothetical protein
MPIKEGDMTTEKDPHLVLLQRQMKRAADMATEHLACRQGALNHAWQAVRPDWDPKVKGVKPMAYQCSRCLTIKRQNVSVRFGELMARPSYEYPEGFVLHRGEGERGRILSAQAVRAAFIKRVQEDQALLPEMVVLRDG